MRPMKYLSVCSGIEAASVAWTPLNWEPVAFSEVDAFPSAVLKHHYPHVPNWGDMTKFQEWPDAAVDVLVGGTPCQSFSVAGLRKGMADPRGNLALVYLGIADRYRPEWLVWENVPGVLSSNGGRDFGAFLGGLAELGYGFAYRVLDAQYFGLAQRRKRVFVVGHLGDWRRAAAVLFEPESLRGDPAPSRQKGQGFTHDVVPSLVSSGRGIERTGETRGQDPVVAVAFGGGNQAGSIDVATAQTAHGTRLDFDTETFIAHALRAVGFDASEDGTGRGTPLVPTLAFHARQDPDSGPVTHPLDTDGASIGIVNGWRVRRLTPRECERLQGFHDDYTAIPYRGKPAADGPRYKALGNSMATPVMRWIGQGIAAIAALKTREAA